MRAATFGNVHIANIGKLGFARERVDRWRRANTILIGNILATKPDVIAFLGDKPHAWRYIMAALTELPYFVLNFYIDDMGFVSKRYIF